MNNKIYLYDSTLRDGAQTHGIDFTVADKMAIAEELDKLGIDYIEGGWPGANHTDDSFFANPPNLKNAKLTAFGMTKRSGIAINQDKGFLSLFNNKAKIVTIVGKTWDFHVTVALGIELNENLKIIKESIEYAIKNADEVFFDAEHFFDGYKANPSFALDCIETAHQAGARWIVLCDTNGGTMPDEIEAIVRTVAQKISGEKLGIHCHNDTGNAVANSLAAVRAGVRHIQGTINGLGERCGNANLITIIPNLMLKMGLETSVDYNNLPYLTHVSNVLNERLNRGHEINAPYIGEAAFAHKGGLHVSAVEKNSKSYEHISPEIVGNRRKILVSEQAGRSNIIASLKSLGINVNPSDPKILVLLNEIKLKELDGLTYEGADASFELFARKILTNDIPDFFNLHSFRVIDERRYNAKGDLITISEATLRVYVDGQYYIEAAEGHGPVDALANGLSKILTPKYPFLKNLKLTDYKVRIMKAEKGTAATTRVMIESSDSSGVRWSTVGISYDIIDASFNALNDSIVYMLIHNQK